MYMYIYIYMYMMYMQITEWLSPITCPDSMCTYRCTKLMMYMLMMKIRI